MMNKKKDHSFYSLKLQDTSLTYWKDILLYLLISGISIAYLMFVLMLLYQDDYTSYFNRYYQVVHTSGYLSSFLTKLTLSPLLNVSFEYQQEIEHLAEFNRNITSFQEQLNIETNQENSKLSFNQLQFEQRNSTLSELSHLQLMNHLIKDNLCYYSYRDLCHLDSQKDYYNTGLLGVIDQLINFYITHQNNLDHFTAESLQKYIASNDFRILSLYGLYVIQAQYSHFQSIIIDYFHSMRSGINQMYVNIYIGIGIPLLFITFILAISEMILLRRKIKYLIFSITYIPTFKFQDKITLSLIKSILKL